MSIFKPFALFLVLLSISLPALSQVWGPGTAHFQYRAGPDLRTQLGREFIRIYSEQPENRYISEELYYYQKFRDVWGAMALRINFTPNTVKEFVVGQDAVDDAEAAKLPGTGTGYSTRVQSIANHHGIDQGLATSNASFQTIKGQYGSFDHPYVELGKNGKRIIKQSRYVDNYLWTIFNGEHSPIRRHREEAWELVLRNNPESPRIVVLYGGASHDGFAEFLIRRGFRVATRMRPENFPRTQVPESRLVYAGGNNEFPVLLTKEGKDLYAELLGRELDYTNPKDQKAAIKARKKAGARAIELMAFTGGGLHDSGVLHPAQLGGYDLTKVEKLVDGKWVATNNLKGLVLLDGTVIESEIAFIASPHPTSLSKNLAEASNKLKEIFEPIEELIGGERAIEPDLDNDGNPRINHFARGDAYDYNQRAYMPRETLPFGAPANILRPIASADRLGPQVLVVEPPSKKELLAAGFRELKDIFDADKLEAAKSALPVEPLDPNDLWNQHSRQEATRYLADDGPGYEWARLMKESFDPQVLEHVPAPTLGDFANYRGTFDQPEVLIIHDRSDLEDRNTYRAASGARGLALNGLMRDLGVERSQLVLATAPVDMTDATDEQWEKVRAGSETYREAVIGKVLAQGSVKVIFTDGKVAKSETTRILRKLKVTGISVIDIPRGADPASGILAAGARAKRLKRFQGAKISGNPAGIPHEHFPWNERDWARVTPGTVIEANAPFKGKTYAIVSPNYVARQELRPRPETVRLVEASKQELEEKGIRPAKEDIASFLKRKGRSGDFLPEALASQSGAASGECEGKFEGK